MMIDIKFVLEMAVLLIGVVGAIKGFGEELNKFREPMNELNVNLIKQTNQITRIEERLLDVTQDIAQMQKKSHDSHERIHKRIDIVEDKTNDLDKRVNILEQK